MTKGGSDLFIGGLCFGFVVGILFALYHLDEAQCGKEQEYELGT